MLAEQIAPQDDLITDYLVNPFGALWPSAMANDLTTAAFAMYYFNPFAVVEEDVDELNPLEAAAYNCYVAKLTDVYGSYLWGLRQGKPDHEIDQLITDAANNYMPEEIVDAEMLAIGALPLPWMGFDWDYAFEETYTSLRDGFRTLAHAVGLTPGADTYDFDKSEASGAAKVFAGSLQSSGYLDLAAALMWMVGTTGCDLLNYGWQDAAHSELHWPGIDEADVWREEAKLCEQYIDFALVGINWLENTPGLQACFAYNTLLLKYQKTMEENHVTIRDDSISAGFVWPERDRNDAPVAADDLDILSFWHLA